LDTKPNTTLEDSLLTRKMIHLALPIRWSPVGQKGRGTAEVACTYDIHWQGARLLSARAPHVGDLIFVERGRNKAICQVVWAGDPASPLRGQFSVRCIEGGTPWDDELRQMEEQYQPIIIDGSQRRGVFREFGHLEANRRRRPRFYVEGHAEVIDGLQSVAAKVREISEYGARLADTETLKPGTDFRLMLNMFDICVAVKARVKYLVENLGMGVEFQEIRRGDRPLLSYALSKLRVKEVEEFVEVEVVHESLAAAVG